MRCDSISVLYGRDTGNAELFKANISSQTELCMKEKNLVVVDDQLVAKHNLEILSVQDDPKKRVHSRFESLAEKS
ncbi:hypothetical protein SDJN02_05873, partial [Cucurbita argyrosperma subsp. argyrosperma]